MSKIPQLPEEWRLRFCNSSTHSTWWTTISQSSVKLPAARISAASKTCQALLGKWVQTHLREKSPGAAAYRLIETPVAKSLIFYPYSLNISLWEAVLLCVELLRNGGQTTKQLSAVVKRLGNQQRNSTPPEKKTQTEWLRPSLPHFDMSQTHPPFLLFPLCCVQHARGETIILYQE